MPEEMNRHNAFAADDRPGADRGAPSGSALNLLGRGLPQFGWMAMVCLFLAVFLPNFGFSLFGPPAFRADYLRFDLWANLISSAVEAVALCWLLANIRSARWLFLTVLAVSLLTAHVYGAAISFVYRFFFSGIFTIEQSWTTVVWQLIAGLCSAAVIVAAVKLPRTFGFAIPLIAAGLKCAEEWLVRSLLVHALPFTRSVLMYAAVEGLAFGLGVWIALERQRRKSITADRPGEPWSSNGAYIFGFAFCSLLGTSLMVAATPVPEGAERYLLLGAGLATSVVSTIIMLVFLYRAWKSIQTPYSIPAGVTIGKLFIPIYSFYWIFQAIPGYAREYGNFAAYRELDLPRVRRGWLIAFALSLLIAGIAPLAAPILLVASFPPDALPCALDSLLTICGVVAIARIADAVNQIPLQLLNPRAVAVASA